MKQNPIVKKIIGARGWIHPSTAIKIFLNFRSFIRLDRLIFQVLQRI